MSAIDLANYVHARMDKLGLTVTSAAQRSGISRQTWHKLMRADIKEAKLSTLIAVASILKTGVPDLVDIYFQPGDKAFGFTRHGSKFDPDCRPTL